MREEIGTEKIFKDDAGYFLRITKFSSPPTLLNSGKAVLNPCSTATLALPDQSARQLF